MAINRIFISILLFIATAEIIVCQSPDPHDSDILANLKNPSQHPQSLFFKPKIIVPRRFESALHNPEEKIGDIEKNFEKVETSGNSNKYREITLEEDWLTLDTSPRPTQFNHKGPRPKPLGNGPVGSPGQDKSNVYPVKNDGSSVRLPSHEQHIFVPLKKEGLSVTISSQKQSEVFPLKNEALSVGLPSQKHSNDFPLKNKEISAPPLVHQKINRQSLAPLVTSPFNDPISSHDVSSNTPLNDVYGGELIPIGISNPLRVNQKSPHEEHKVYELEPAPSFNKGNSLSSNRPPTNIEFTNTHLKRESSAAKVGELSPIIPGNPGILGQDLSHGEHKIHEFKSGLTFHNVHSSKPPPKFEQTNPHLGNPNGAAHLEKLIPIGPNAQLKLGQDLSHEEYEDREIKPGPTFHNVHSGSFSRPHANLESTVPHSKNPSGTIERGKLIPIGPSNQFKVGQDLSHEEHEFHELESIPTTHPIHSISRSRPTISLKETITHSESVNYDVQAEKLIPVGLGNQPKLAHELSHDEHKFPQLEPAPSVHNVHSISYSNPYTNFETPVDIPVETVTSFIQDPHDSESFEPPIYIPSSQKDPAPSFSQGKDTDITYHSSPQHHPSVNGPHKELSFEGSLGVGDHIELNSHVIQKEEISHPLPTFKKDNDHNDFAGPVSIPIEHGGDPSSGITSFSTEVGHHNVGGKSEITQVNAGASSSFQSEKVDLKLSNTRLPPTAIPSLPPPVPITTNLSPGLHLPSPQGILPTNQYFPSTSLKTFGRYQQSFPSSTPPLITNFNPFMTLFQPQFGTVGGNSGNLNPFPGAYNFGFNSGGRSYFK